MRRRRLYIFLTLLLLSLWGTKYLDFFIAEEVRRDEAALGGLEAFNPIICADINSRGITLTVDGEEKRPGYGQPIYMTEKRELMVPLTMVPEAFYCAAGYYDNSRLVLEKNGARVEIMLGEKEMKVNQVNMPLDEGLVEKEGTIYVPIQAIELGFAYQVQWSAETNTMSLTASEKKGRTLPYVFDYRQEGRAPLIRNQGNLGTCWAFASLMALESSLLPEQPLTFSADNMSINNSFHLTQDEGGEYTMSMAYLLAWQGPVLEELDPYGDKTSPPGLQPVKHVQEIQLLPSKDYEKIKEAVYLHGGVQSSLYTSLKNEKSRSVYYNKEKAAYCYIGTEKPNHDVVIVGWDDNYPRENFNLDLEGDGAFLCANSWGRDFGDNGYFYVSYYDTNIGIHNILYTSAEEPDNYDRIYQSDLCGWIGQLGYGRESAYFANVYTAEKDEVLEAAGFYATGPDTEYQLFAVEDFAGTGDLSGRELVAEGKFDNAGFYTVPFEREINLTAGQKFAVVVKITTPGSVHPIAIEYQAEDKKRFVDLSDGEGYVSFRGNGWERSEETQFCNVCLKAYTRER